MRKIETHTEELFDTKDVIMHPWITEGERVPIVIARSAQRHYIGGYLGTDNYGLEVLCYPLAFLEIPTNEGHSRLALGKTYSFIDLLDLVHMSIEEKYFLNSNRTLDAEFSKEYLKAIAQLDEEMKAHEANLILPSGKDMQRLREPEMQNFVKKVQG